MSERLPLAFMIHQTRGSIEVGRSSLGGAQFRLSFARPFRRRPPKHLAKLYIVDHSLSEWRDRRY
jgi:hypothetical protein